MAVDGHDRRVEDLLSDLQATFRRAYGRDWDPVARRMTTSLRGAGYGTTGGWWSLAAALDRAGTTFAAERQRAQLDAMLADVLLWPEQPATGQWAQRYGFASSSAAGRALRRGCALGIGDARRLGRLAAWLAAAQRQPRTAEGLQRRNDAIRELNEMQQHATERLGPRSQRAFALLLSGEWPRHPGKRRRYPAATRRSSARITSESGR